jgi:hypothetical protein
MTILLDPTSEGLKDEYGLAPRKFRSLDGVRLGLLGNSKLNADKVLEAVGELISQRYAVETVYHRMKPSFSRPVPDELKQEMLAHCDVVIAGVGD